MDESSLTGERNQEITREAVIAAYRPFVERGIKSPFDLDSRDLEVVKAHQLEARWREQEDEKAQGDKELGFRDHLSQTMLYIDAGFRDAELLKDTIDVLAEGEIDRVPKERDNPERVEIRNQMALALYKVKRLLAEQEKA